MITLKNKLLLFFLTIVNIFLFTGCYNYNELNNLAIVTGISIDKKDDEYILNALIANSKKQQVSGKEGESQMVVFEGKGKTIEEAIKSINLESSRQIYIGHLSIVILSKKIAKDGVLDILDYLLRNPESTKRFYLAVSKEDTAKEILKVISPLESFPSQDLYTNIKNAGQTQAISSNITYSIFVENILKKGANPVLPTLYIEGKSDKGASQKNTNTTTPKAIVRLGTDAIFKKDKLIYITKKEESVGINLISKKATETTIKAKYKGKYFMASLKQIKKNIKVKFNNGIPTIYIELKANGFIDEINSDVNLLSTSVINNLNEAIENKVTKILEKGIKVAKDNKTDVLGLGNLVYKKNPKFYNSIDEWDEFLKNLNIKVTVKTNLKTKGSLKQTIRGFLNEK